MGYYGTFIGMKNTPLITQLSMLILMEADLSKAVSFYQTLGLPLLFQIPESWAEFQLPNGIKLCLCPTSNPAIERRTGIVFEVKDVRSLYDDLQDKIDFIGEPLEKVHGIMVGVKDPGGNIIDLYQPTPEKVTELVKKVKKEQE